MYFIQQETIVMFTRILVCSVLAAGLTQGAYAQSTATPPTASKATAQSNQSIPQELRQKLTADGFTDVHIMPSSFLVSAKNKSGEPVMMRISPDSMTVLTEEPADQTTGSGADSTIPKAK
jgi:hypothetical protein